MFCLKDLDPQHLRCTALPLTLLFAVDAHKFANTRWSSPSTGAKQTSSNEEVFCFLNLHAECEHVRNMSPFLTCFPRLLSAKPFGWGHTRLSHIKRRRLIMPLVALVQKKQSAPATAYKFWCSALPSSSPLLLAFRHATSKCLYNNATNRHSAK